jgi:hypothetical protein
MVQRKRSRSPSAKSAKTFSAEIYQGHTTDCGVLVPFDPAKAWKTEPRCIGYRSHMGHATLGKVGGEQFESWIFHYFHEWRMVVDGATLAKIGAGPGDTVKFTLRPHPRPEEVALFQPGPKRR